MFRREISCVVESRLRESRKFMQIAMGPRQTGKPSAVRQALESLGGLEAFVERHPGARPLVVGGNANPLEDFLRGDVPLFP